MFFVFFLLSLNYRNHIIEDERQSRKIGKVTRLSLDDVPVEHLWAEGADGEGMKAGGHVCLFKPEGERRLPPH